MEELLAKVVNLLESGSDEGCDGLVVVGRREFMAVRRAVADMTDNYHGDVGDDNE